ncbi:MAG: hypothetical protein FWD23_04450 [Oscillospiraceae bacterium]|nr:hypothetical protein [Oscillospiraceae bacterium]
MNYRERILAAINHELPDHVPAHVIVIDDIAPFLSHLGFDDWETLYDYLGIGMRQTGAGYSNTKPGVNHFGTSGGGSDYSTSTFEIPFAGVESTDEIEKYDWPKAENCVFDHIPPFLEKYRGKYATMINGWNPIFCQVLDLFGMENALTRICLEPEFIEAAVSHIEDFYLEFYKRLFKAADKKADIFNIGDDFATQRGMLISPAQWRRYFKPKYKKIFALAKSHGLYVWFHSCGAISEVLPDLVDIGIDVWETVQVHLSGNEPEKIKRNFGRDITFSGGINTQSTLPYGTPGQIRAEVRERIEILGKGGGYICAPDHHIKTDVPVENALAMFDEIKNFRCGGCTL